MPSRKKQAVPAHILVFAVLGMAAGMVFFALFCADPNTECRRAAWKLLDDSLLRYEMKEADEFFREHCVWREGKPVLR